MPNPYQTLGVAKTADRAAIKRAYHKLAKELHPDLNPGDVRTEKRFQQVSAAYDLLSDPKKRARFDRGEIDSDGNEQPTFRSGFGGGGFPPNSGRGSGRSGAKTGGAKAGERARGFKFPGGFDAEELLSELFGDENKRGGSALMRGQDYKVSVTVRFEDAARGGKKRINLPDGRVIDLTIPAGSEDGQTLRLRGQGQSGLGGAAPGDALVRLSVAPHPFFTRKGADIHVEVPVTLPEAVLGGKILVPTIDGPVTVTAPKGSNTGTKLRLKGKGTAVGKKGARGDQLIRFKVMLPDRVDKELSDFIDRWSLTNGYDVRKKAGMI